MTELRAWHLHTVRCATVNAARTPRLSPVQGASDASEPRDGDGYR